MQRLTWVCVLFLGLGLLAGCEVGSEHSIVYGRGVGAMEDVGKAAKEFGAGGPLNIFAARLHTAAGELQGAALALRSLPSASRSQANSVRRQYSLRIRAAGKKLELISTGNSNSPQQLLQILDPMLMMMEGLLAMDEALGFPDENDMRTARNTLAQLKSMRTQISGGTPYAGNMSGSSQPGMNSMASAGMSSSYMPGMSSGSMPGMYPGLSSNSPTPGFSSGLPLTSTYSNPSTSSYASSTPMLGSSGYPSSPMLGGGYGSAPAGSMGMPGVGTSAGSPGMPLVGTPNPAASYGLPNGGTTSTPSSSFAGGAGGGAGMGSTPYRSKFSSPPHEKLIAEIIAVREEIVLALEFVSTKSSAMNARESIKKSVEKMKGIAQRIEKLKPLSEGDWQELQRKHGDKLAQLDQKYDFALSRVNMGVSGASSIFKNTTAEIKQANEQLRKAFVSVTKSQFDEPSDPLAGDAAPLVDGFDVGSNQAAEKPTRQPADAPALKALKPKQPAANSAEKPAAKPSRSEADSDPDFSGFGGS